MKAVVIYYSRTGKTEKVAKSFSRILNARLVEIKDQKKRTGFFGYLGGGRDSTLKRITMIEPFAVDMKKYNLVLIGTPVWSWSMAPAIRTFLRHNNFSGTKVIPFCTMGGSGGERVIKIIKEIVESKKGTVIDSIALKSGDEQKMLNKARGFARRVKNKFKRTKRNNLEQVQEKEGDIIGNLFSE